MYSNALAYGLGLLTVFVLGCICGIRIAANAPSAQPVASQAELPLLVAGPTGEQGDDWSTNQSVPAFAIVPATARLSKEKQAKAEYVAEQSAECPVLPLLKQAVNPAMGLVGDQLDEHVDLLQQQLANRFEQATDAQTLLWLAVQADSLERGHLERRYADKLLRHGVNLSAEQQYQLLQGLEGDLLSSHVAALSRYLQSSNQQVQEEAYLRLEALPLNVHTRHHYEFLAYNGISEWLRRQALQQLE